MTLKATLLFLCWLAVALALLIGGITIGGIMGGLSAAAGVLAFIFWLGVAIDILTQGDVP